MSAVDTIETTNKEVRLEQGGEVAATAAAAPRTWENWLNLVAYVFNSAITYGSLTGIFGETNTDLSSKYPTLVTPAGYAFAIWGLIFAGEGIWAVAQLFQRYSQQPVVRAASPWWWGACLAQIFWTLAFAQEAIALALFFMISILTALLGAVLSIDASARLGVLEYLLLRAPFALHLGWIIAASALNVNVLADYERADPPELLGLAVISIVAVVTANTCLAVGTKTPEPVANLVAAWAFFGIANELQDPSLLNDPDRWNPYMWDDVTLEGLHYATQVASVGALLLAVVSTAVRVGILGQLSMAVTKRMDSSSPAPLA